MKSINLSKLTTYLTYLGLLIWLSAFFLDYWIRDWFFPSSWGSTATMMILPYIGLFVIMFSVYCKKLWTGLIGILFVVAFPLTFFFAYFIFGP